MKRCPQCEFIYEDEQSLCDMDGILLVFDSQQFPKPVTSSKSQGRNRTVPAAATLVLAVVLGLVYYVSTRQQPASPDYVPSPATVAQPVTTTGVAPPMEQPASEVKSAEPIKAKPAASTGPTGTVKKSESKPKATSVQKTIKPTPTQQDDSKIGSLIKKTGRLLKKPFKL